MHNMSYENYGRPGFDSRQRQEVILLSTASKPALGATQRPIEWVPWNKRPGREADYSPPSSVVKNDGAILPLPIRLHGVVLH
jgi:hypothetical protein